MTKLFDLECTSENAKVLITPVPWEVTTSYGGGTSLAPDKIRAASVQIDSFRAQYPEHGNHKYFLKNTNEGILKSSQNNQKKAQKVYAATSPQPDLVKEVNEASDSLNDYVYQETKKTLVAGKIPGSLGGDHSIPFGAIKAVAEKHSDYSILHIDAHHDFREAYYGFTHSHASIFYNVMQSDFSPTSLVQMGIRDFCEEEYLFAKSKENISVFYDYDVQRNLLSNTKSWDSLCNEVLAKLSDKVYISFDIDGLDPALCPGTGTPVPGGLSFVQWQHLIHKIVASGKSVIGFDLVEVAGPKDSEFDANVGMRILFDLCLAADLTNP